MVALARVVFRPESVAIAHPHAIQYFFKLWRDGGAFLDGLQDGLARQYELGEEEQSVECQLRVVFQIQVPPVHDLQGLARLRRIQFSVVDAEEDVLEQFLLLLPGQFPHLIQKW